MTTPAIEPQLNRQGIEPTPSVVLAPDPQAKHRHSYRPEIDGIRALAVLAVVLYHMGFSSFSGGFVGVDVFLVLSGYLIVGVVWRQLESGERFRLWEFYRRRVLRLFPALITVVAATMAVGAWVLLPTDLDRLGQMSATTMSYVSNVWLWRNTGYFGSTAELLPLLHMWSLSVEEQFYLALPLVLLAIHRWGRAWGLHAIVFVGVVSFLLAQYFLAGRQSAVFYLTPFRAWEFVAGGVLAVLAWAPRRRGVSEVGALAGLALVISPVVIYDHGTEFPGVAALAPVMGTGLLLTFMNRSGGWVQSALSWKPFVVLGRLSYSLYLWHWPVLVLLRHVYGDLTAVQLSAASVVMMMLSWATYAFVETPLRTPSGPRAGMVLRGALVSSGALLVCGLGLAVGDGFPGRVTDDVRALDQAREPKLPFMDCFGGSPQRADCLLGAQEARPKWLLWGDSHALALAPALDNYLRGHGESALFIASSACPPLLGVRSRDVHGGDSRCGLLERRLLRAFEVNDQLQAVVMVASWNSYATSATRRMAGPQGEDITSRVFRDGLERTIPGLREKGLAVLSVGPVPIQPWSVPLELARVARWGGEMRPATTRSVVSQVEDGFRSVATTLIRAPGGAPARFVGLTEHFCGTEPDSECRFRGERGPLYRDRGHLNLVGAEFAMGYVGPAMDLLRKDIEVAAAVR